MDCFFYKLLLLESLIRTISRFFSRVSLGFLEKFMFLWNWLGGTGNFLYFLVGFLIWQSREFKILHGLARIFMFFLVGFLIWRNREFKILHGLARIFMFFLVGFLIWRNREFKILHGLARIFLISVGFFDLELDLLQW